MYTHTHTPTHAAILYYMYLMHVGNIHVIVSINFSPGQSVPVPQVP